MGLFGLFESDETKMEKESIGKKVSCVHCGSEYYELKTSTLPSELSQKYYYGDAAMQCTSCGKIYCASGYCSMIGCSCGGRNYMTIISVKKFTKWK